jgi:nucleoside-diphosphate-sugar epimerase
LTDVLITGGAGFIGSNLARSLVASGDRVRVLDNLVTGSLENLTDLDDSIEFVRGDVRELDDLRRATAGVDVVYHLAALPSVARSMADPLASHASNALGTLNVLVAARDHGVRRVVYASSSSIYGDSPSLPKHEEMPVNPLSPYAASKLAGESYCRAFTRAFGLETVSLRFFNVFGPSQDPTSPYAAVIPRFASRMLDGLAPVVFGDGGQSRDFTFVANAVQACELAAGAGPEAAGEVMNVGCGDRITLLDLVDALNDVLGSRIEPEFAGPQPGDVRHSLASIDKGRRLLGYEPLIGVRDGIRETVRWLQGTEDHVVLIDDAAVVD